MKIDNPGAPTVTVKKKSKFPWGTIFLTGVVSTVGTIVAMKMYEAASKKRAGDDDLNAQRDALLNPGGLTALPQAMDTVPAPRTLVISEDALLALTQQGQLH